MRGRLAQPAISRQQASSLHPNADTIKLERDDVYGRMFIAKQDIEIGDVVLEEKMFIRSIINFGYDCCSKCGKKYMNFIPCNDCSGAMYCTKTCADTSFHRFECGMAIETTTEDVDELIFIIRSIIVAIESFKNVNELVAFIESPTTKASQSKYGVFFHLATGVVSNERVLDCLETASIVYHAIVTSSKLKQFFETTHTRRFLEHLIIHHYFVLSTNAFGNQSNESHIRQISLSTSYLNHSCLPNVAKLSTGDISVCKAILPIKKGDQLFLTYIADNVFEMTEKVRNDQLEKSYGFRCRCSLCRNGPLHVKNLEKDTNFVYVSVNAVKIEEKYEIELLQSLIKRCIVFLIKYSKMVGSQELYYIADTFI